MWELRGNLTAYDATYVALAEVLDTIVLTCDAPLSRAPGVKQRVELVVPAKRIGPNTYLLRLFSRGIRNEPSRLDFARARSNAAVFL